ncbi:MAG: hypothetical protein P8186_16640 [Anaerolineae bacterium]|jgi:hypothetical protein
MTRNNLRGVRHRRLCSVALLCILVLSQITGAEPVQAQESGPVQILTGQIDERSPGGLYLLPGLKQGQELYVYVEGASGNLDPLAALVKPDVQVGEGKLSTEFQGQVERAVLEGRDPLGVLGSFGDEYFLAWDDDGGEGYAAAFSSKIPSDGNYLLLVTSSPFKNTFGAYRLLIGLDAPEVLTGQPTTSTSDRLAIPQGFQSTADVAIQELGGTLTPQKRSTFFNLDDAKPGDTLYAYIETTSGDLAPALVLSDFGGKPVAAGNIGGQAGSARLQYNFAEAGRNYRLEVESGRDELAESGYRLLVGLNAPQVLTGEAESVGRAVLLAPIEAQVGVRLQQITDIDQKGENYNAVVGIRMEWTDPSLAFSPDACECRTKVFAQKDFDQFVALTGGRWPEFTLFNQQGNRWTQNRLAAVQPDGHATYFERFTTTFQAPDFDFRKFPFDTQHFFIRLDAIFPEELLVFSDLGGFTAVGTQLGEEEFYVTDFDTKITSETATTGEATSSYTFHFRARRHLIFYIVRIFVPLGLIILVAWITFFLKDYGKRIEATSANLLLFIAFNFTIGADLPRLGYLTFLDTILIGAFLISVFMVVYNVYLKRLELNEKEERAERIDRYMIWLYPLGYLLVFGLMVVTFF